ncbi:LuxR family quorum-sensing system transcriptional regulator ExpR [Serratia fonticola]|uniref:LuxR family quorum-sensing system transcriptional regulator ExpR n=1 Tax=Serratia fonticola TaxID=47917 RepID=A0A542BQY8_SERFO|nr:LuxR C-terminal-related transcriptional regulator [Serratia fonticola]TQI80897.1 LuxR family quorum-sensing system transcriptional regulator ExpR [Serratia fonticola]TQI97078.1 LuxR family quorum-sensing system transcriptional regulator ExpR [Serratia fonticola]TVZ71574.1 LuxR family quorum-sensing system transcriptional regulator ExpR [Serratia fonticola]
MLNHKRIKVFFDEYILGIEMKYYSVVIVSSLHNNSVYSNLPKSWQRDFLRNKLDVRSDIVIKAKKKIVPFIWHSKDINEKHIQAMSKKYSIYMGATFIVNINSDIILFNLYVDNSEQSFIDLFDKNKIKIQYDILTFFESIYSQDKTIIFTFRESEVLNLIKLGKTYEMIADILEISERTVRFHVDNILLKLEASSVKYAIFKATRLGLI